MLLLDCVFVLFGAFDAFGAFGAFGSLKNKEFKTVLMTSFTLLLFLSKKKKSFTGEHVSETEKKLMQLSRNGI